MEQVNIYTYTDIVSPRRQDGMIAYLLETQTSRGPATLYEFAPVQQMTNQQAELTAIIGALKHIRKKCRIVIFTKCGAILTAFEQGRVNNWLKNGWKTAKNTPVANRSEWQEMLNLLCGTDFRIEVTEKTEYSAWMAREAERRR